MLYCLVTHCRQQLCSLRLPNVVYVVKGAQAIVIAAQEVGGRSEEQLNSMY